MACDICEIKNLIYEYAHHMDTGDLGSVAAMFARGSILAWDDNGRMVPIAGVEAVREHYASFTRLYADRGTPHTIHMTTNVLVEVGEGADKANATSCAVVFQALADFPLQPIIGVRYRDTFVKSNGVGETVGWHFETRRIEPLLLGDLSRHLLRAIPE